MASMEVRDLSERQLRMSVRRLSEEFGMARETVMKRLQMANAKPAAMVSGHPVFSIRVAAEAILSPVGRGEDGEIDPRTLPPSDRNAWYQSEIRRVELDMKCQQLVPVAEVQAEMAELVKSAVQFLDTLADQIERDCSLTPEQVQAINESITRQRQSMWESVGASDDDLRERA